MSQTTKANRQSNTLNYLYQSHVPDLYREKLSTVPRKFDLTWDEHLRESNITKHKIEIFPDAWPVIHRLYWKGMKARIFVMQMVQRLRKGKGIEPAFSKWASTVVIVPRKDVSVRPDVLWIPKI